MIKTWKRVGGILVEHTINGVHQSLTKAELKEWPIFLRPMKLMAKDGDKGLGDIVERVIGPIGGEAYKLWYKTTFGKECAACLKRKGDLNLRYPL
jgi:hypothetical protein